MAVGLAEVRAWLGALARVCAQRCEWLTELDAAERGFAAVVITSLEMARCSLRADDELLALWVDPGLTPGLRWRA